MINNIISKLYEKNICPSNIITYSLCTNAFGLLSLIYGEFLLFILLFSLSMYLNKVFKKYKKRYDFKNRKIDIYFNFADYIKILSTYTFFTLIYKKKINKFITGISIVLLILCNINFTIEQLLNIYDIDDKDTYNYEDKDTHEERQNNKIFNNYYKKLFSWIKKDTLKKLYNFTKYFSEILVISYFISLMIIIHYI